MSFAHSALGEQPLNWQPTPVKVVDDHLMPPNATPFERGMAKTLSRISDIPIPIADLWNPSTCPSHILKYLAWAVNVDFWDSAWPLKTKRAVVAAAIQSHKIKGTRKAVTDALDLVGITAVVEEWWETDPAGTPGTFKIKLYLGADVFEAGDTLITDTRINLATKIVDRVKRLSQHYTVESGVKVGLSSSILLAQRTDNHAVCTGDLAYSHTAYLNAGALVAGKYSNIIMMEAIL